MSTPPAFTPPAQPIDTGWTSIASEGGRMDAYLALPPARHGPGLLLLQEIFGVNAHIRAVADQWALAGFTVLAPDLFWRQARRVELGYEGADREQALGLMRALDPAQAVADLQAGVTALKALPACNGRTAALGYCMGGRLAFAAAAHAKLDAAVAYYGGGIANQLDAAARIHCPVQFHHAEDDAAIPLEAVARIEAAMASAPAAALAEFHRYPGAHHGFNCWSRASYHAGSAALALGRSLQFLARLF